jgi:hypothetical protein
MPFRLRRSAAPMGPVPFRSPVPRDAPSAYLKFSTPRFLGGSMWENVIAITENAPIL